MIQRIQTLYLLGAIIFFVLMLCFPFGYLVTKDAPLAFYPLGISMATGVHYTLTIFIVLILALIAEVVTILLFNNRVLQMRFIVFNCVLQVGLYIAIVAMTLILKSEMSATFSFNWPLVLPLLTIILNVLSYKAIHKDEALVRSLNHLR